MTRARLFKSVVLPDPLPPEMTMLSRPRTAAARNSDISVASEPRRTSSSSRNVLRAARLRQSVGPRSAKGAMTAVRRAPSGSFTSTEGERSSIRALGLFHQPPDESEQMGLVGEANLGRFQQAVALDADVVGAVDEDVAHRGIGKERLQGAEAVDLVEDFADHPLADVGGQAGQVRRQDVGRERLQIVAEVVFAPRRELRKVDRLDHAAMQDRLQFLKRLAIVESDCAGPRSWLVPIGRGGGRGAGCFKLQGRAGLPL